MKHRNTFRMDSTFESEALDQRNKSMTKKLGLIDDFQNLIAHLCDELVKQLWSTEALIHKLQNLQLLFLLPDATETQNKWKWNVNTDLYSNRRAKNKRYESILKQDITQQDRWTSFESWRTGNSELLRSCGVSECLWMIYMQHSSVQTVILKDFSWM